MYVDGQAAHRVQPQSIRPVLKFVKAVPVPLVHWVSCVQFVGIPVDKDHAMRAVSEPALQQLVTMRVIAVLRPSADRHENGRVACRLVQLLQDRTDQGPVLCDRGRDRQAARAPGQDRVEVVVMHASLLVQRVSDGGLTHSRGADQIDRWAHRSDRRTAGRIGLL